MNVFQLNQLVRSRSFNSIVRISIAMMSIKRICSESRKVQGSGSSITFKDTETQQTQSSSHFFFSSLQAAGDGTAEPFARC